MRAEFRAWERSEGTQRAAESREQAREGGRKGEIAPATTTTTAAAAAAAATTTFPLPQPSPPLPKAGRGSIRCAGEQGVGDRSDTAVTSQQDEGRGGEEWHQKSSQPEVGGGGGRRRKKKSKLPTNGQQEVTTTSNGEPLLGEKELQDKEGGRRR